LAIGALVSWNLDGPRVPGSLRVGVLASESSLRTERAVGPLAVWLAASVGRAGEVVAPGRDGLEELEARSEVMLVPAAEAEELDPRRVLAWIRPVGRPSSRVDYQLLVASLAPGSGRCGVATEDLLGELESATELEGTGCDSVDVAGSPFAERELLRAFAAGAYRCVLVRASEADDASLAGWLTQRAHTRTPVGPSRPWMALVASVRLEPDLRNRVRDSALDLDKYRLDPSHHRAASVLHALAEFGIGGFAPVDAFAALRR
jgi:hypothetical protein